MAASPDVSVIIPCYNDGAFLEETLKSLGDYKGRFILETIVVNDGSDDPATLETFRALQPVYEFRLINRLNGGLPAARNTGIEASSAPFFLTLDADDLIIPDFIETAAAFLSRNPKTGVVFGNCEFFGEKQGVRVARYDKFQQAFTNLISATAVIRKKVWTDNGGYDESMRLGYEDWEFWLHAMKNGWEFRHIDMISFKYRIRKVSLSKTSIKNHEDIVGYIQHKHLDFIMKNYLELTRELHDVKNNRKRLMKYLVRNISGKTN